jgi:hypothetical protein
MAATTTDIRTDTMARFLATLLWTAVFLLILLAIDQLLVRVPASHPAHVAVTTFYRDLRSRVIELAKGVKAPPAPAAPAKPAPLSRDNAKTSAASVEAIIEQRRPAASAATAKPVNGSPAAAEPAPRYVYADDRGELHFAETLAEVPEQYRDKARRLGE